MKKRLIFLLCSFLLWLPLFAIQKPLFMIYHGGLGEYSLFNFMEVIYRGLKLDASIAGYLTIIPLLCAIASSWTGGNFYHKILKSYFLIAAIINASIFALDQGLYTYWGFRIDATVLFYLQDPDEAMASTPIGIFLMQFLTMAVYSFVIYKLFARFVIPLLPEKPEERKVKSNIAFVLLGGLMFIAIRGGVTTSTANVGMVYFSDNQFLNHSAINPTFSLMTSILKQQDFSSQFQFFDEEERQKAFSFLSSNNEADSTTVNLLKTSRPDILIVLLESFSANVIEATGGEPDITPNLNRLSKEGVLFRNMYANSFRTDRGLVAVLNGYLAQPTTSIMKYPSKSQTLPSIAGALGKEGYTSDMLYGGDINFTNMKSYFFSSGYKKIVSDIDFPIASRLSKWGANDDVTFAHLYDVFKNKNDDDSPWMTTFLTLSSHEPFKVPYSKFEHLYANSVAFTDSCLGDFIDKVKELPVWDNLLVVFVSDHGFRYPESVKEFAPGRYHIPMIWVGGAIKEAMVIDKYANQTDLTATLLSQMNIDHKDFIFSRNVLSSGYNEYAYYTFSNGFSFIDSTGVTIYDNDSHSPLLIKEEAGHDARLYKGKALLQTLYKDMGNR